MGISSAIYYLISKHLGSVEFIGVEHQLTNLNGDRIRPDIVAFYDSNGLLFEIKWSLPLEEEYLERRIKELKKYMIRCLDWRSRGDSFENHDLVLLCHIDDVERALGKIESLSKNPEYAFL